MFCRITDFNPYWPNLENYSKKMGELFRKFSPFRSFEIYIFRMLSKIVRRGLSSSAACAGRIKVANPVVEMDGDEMTRIIWEKVSFSPNISTLQVPRL